MKKALLMYASGAFDPHTGIGTTMSNGVIAKSLYETLSSTGYSVDYIGPEDADRFEQKNYDLFVGQPLNWVIAADRSCASKCILFMPTTHPIRRTKIMIKEAIRWRSSIEEWLPIEKNDIEAFRKADLILQIGNQYAVEALIRNGIPPEKIIHIHYGINHLPVLEDYTIRNTSNFLYLASIAGIRKGFPKILELSIKINDSLKLAIVGKILRESWEERLRKVLNSNSNINFIGWVDSCSNEYQKTLSNNAWLLFPTVEEGEPGTVLEAMSLGIVPLLTSKGSGIDFSIINNRFDICIEKQFMKAKSMSGNNWLTLSRQARQYVKVLHNYDDWLIRLKNIWGKINSKPFYNKPKVSVILPIHNKEKTINSILNCLWKTTRSYINWDLHIIYDGCTDGTRTVSPKTLSNFSICIYEYEKPNIFEVRANNFGLKMADGEYCIILQDDIFIKEAFWLEQMIAWMEQYPRIAVLGGLAGVNFFSRSLKAGNSETILGRDELFTRLDWRSTPRLKNIAYEVDAVMRGPIVLRKSLLESLGYLDEGYAPLYNDDMDYCFKIRSLGYSVFCYPIDVENRSLTMSNYDPIKRRYMDRIMKENIIKFYEKWEHMMGNHTHYLCLPKPHWSALYEPRTKLSKIRDQLTMPIYLLLARTARRSFLAARSLLNKR